MYIHAMVLFLKCGYGILLVLMIVMCRLAPRMYEHNEKTMKDDFFLRGDER